MRSSFDKAFELVIGLEGKPSNDPDDPGGFTIWGLAKRYHPEVNKSTTIEYAKEVYLKQYWISNNCDDAEFPMDIILFDSAVNPQNDPALKGSGNKELLELNPENWQDFLLLRMARYLRVSKRKYVFGHIARVLRLYNSIRSIANEPDGGSS